MTNIKNATTTAKAVGQAYDNQPAWLRFKGTIIIIATGLVSILSQVAALPEWDGTTVGVACTVVATVVGALVNRLTKDGITPSMIRRAAAFAPADPEVTDPDPKRAFPAVNPDTDYAAYLNHLTPDEGDEYRGVHRAE